MLHMTKAKMEKLSIRLPPLAEQKRIVEKVDDSIEFSLLEGYYLF